MIIQHLGRNKCNYLKKKSIEEKRLKLLQHSLMVLKISIIHFPSKATQEAKRHYFPHNSTPTSMGSPSKQVDYSATHNPRQPNVPKQTFHKEQATS
jgi:hypothetical protein